jgi:hypothetical protein
MYGYVGIWFGGSGYAQSSWADHAEFFPSIQAAKDALWGRYHDGRVQETRIVWGDNGLPAVGESTDLSAPSVSLESEIWLVAFEHANLDDLQRDGYPVVRVFFGPRGGVKVERP